MSGTGAELAHDFPLSCAQQGMWLLERLSGTTAYVDPMTFRLVGELDREVLRHSLEQLRRRHEMLRSTFVMADAGPVCRIGDDSTVDLPLTDLSGLSEHEREAELEALLAADAGRRFDLARGPVLRAALYRLGPREHVLRLAAHHLVSDAWSWWNVLLRDLETCYRAGLAGRDEEPEPVAGRYADFVDRQRAWSESAGYRGQLEYWKRQLADLPAPVHASAQSGAGVGTAWATFPQPLYAGLAELARRERVSLFMLLLAGFTLALHRGSGASDIALGTRAALRSRPEFERTVGFFVNLLVIRNRFDPEESFRTLLRTVRGNALGAYANREVPFEKVVEELRPPRRGRFPTMVDVLFSFQSTPETPPQLPGLTATLINHDPQTLYALDLVLYEEHGALRALLSHDRSRYSDEAAADLLTDLQALLEAVLRDPEQSLTTLLASTEGARHDG